MPSYPINVQRSQYIQACRAYSLASVFVALTAQYAHAQERTLIGINGGPNVIVWKNQDSLQQGTDLVSAGVGKKNPARIVGLIACIVPSGTSAIVAGSSNVLVTSGEPPEAASLPIDMPSAVNPSLSVALHFRQ